MSLQPFNNVIPTQDRVSSSLRWLLGKSLSTHIRQVCLANGYTDELSHLQFSRMANNRSMSCCDDLCKVIDVVELASQDRVEKSPGSPGWNEL